MNSTTPAWNVASLSIIRRSNSLFHICRAVAAAIIITAASSFPVALCIFSSHVREITPRLSVQVRERRGANERDRQKRLTDQGRSEECHLAIRYRASIGVAEFAWINHLLSSSRDIPFSYGPVYGKLNIPIDKRHLSLAHSFIRNITVVVYLSINHWRQVFLIHVTSSIRNN